MISHLLTWKTSEVKSTQYGIQMMSGPRDQAHCQETITNPSEAVGVRSVCARTCQCMHVSVSARVCLSQFVNRRSAPMTTLTSKIAAIAG